MISAVVLTKNEEKNIAQCLQSLMWCDEVVVIDDNSRDLTVEIAKKHGAVVWKRSLENNFAAQRNFGLAKASGDWVLFIDADEIVTPALSEEITLVTRKSDNLITGYLIKRQDVMWGRELRYGESGNIKLLRLAKKTSGKWKRAVHEEWQMGHRETGELENPLMHYPHQTISEFISDIDRYSTLHAQELAKEGKSANILKVMMWPKLKFLQNWVLRFGFLDGTAGFVFALLMSFHSYLAWSKLWLIQRKVISNK